MKTIATAVVILTLASTSIRAQTNAIITPKVGMIECGIIMAITVSASLAVVWVYTKCSYYCANHWLVLERDHLDGNWEPILTNKIYVSTIKCEVFHEVPRELGCRYRVIDRGLAD